MRLAADFEHPEEYKMILKDSLVDNLYYGLDDFDCKYLRIVQTKFGCQNSFHTIPEKVKMEMAVYEWNDKKDKFVLNTDKPQIVQLNRLENVILNHSIEY